MCSTGLYGVDCITKTPILNEMTVYYIPTVFNNDMKQYVISDILQQTKFVNGMLEILEDNESLDNVFYVSTSTFKHYASIGKKNLGDYDKYKNLVKEYQALDKVPDKDNVLNMAGEYSDMKHLTILDSQGLLLNAVGDITFKRICNTFYFMNGLVYSGIDNLNLIGSYSANDFTNIKRNVQVVLKAYLEAFNYQAEKYSNAEEYRLQELKGFQLLLEHSLDTINPWNI